MLLRYQVKDYDAMSGRLLEPERLSKYRSLPDLQLFNN